MSHASCLESAVSFLGLGLCRLLIRGLSLQASSRALSFCRNPSPCPWSRLGAVRPCWLGLCESWRQHLVFHYGLPAPPPPRPMKPRVAHWPGAPHSRAWHSVGVPLSGGRLGDLRKDGFHSQFLHCVAVSTCTSEGQVPGLTSPVK